MPGYCTTRKNSAVCSLGNLTYSNDLVFGSRSHSLSLVPYSTDNNNNSGQSADEAEGQRKHSSTRGDFLDLSGNFLSFSSSVARVDMSDSGNNSEEQTTGLFGGFMASGSSREPRRAHSQERHTGLSGDFGEFVSSDNVREPM